MDAASSLTNHLLRQVHVCLYATQVSFKDANQISVVLFRSCTVATTLYGSVTFHIRKCLCSEFFVRLQQKPAMGKEEKGWGGESRGVGRREEGTAKERKGRREGG